MVYYFGLIGYAHLWGIVRKKCELDLVMAKRVMLDKKRKCLAWESGWWQKSLCSCKGFSGVGLL